jgi:TusA-related sulfurtransferase
MEITENTNINKLLKNYPALEDFLMSLNPKYKKLKNPILRRTIANIATLKQVALIGGYSSHELVNLLRKEVGQEPILESEDKKENLDSQKDIPKWIESEPKIVIDANKLLDAEKNPLSEVSKELKKLNSGDILMIKSDFLPQPLIDKFEEEGFEVFAKELNSDKFKTYILK